MKILIGKILCKIFKYFPSSDLKLNFGGKYFRELACSLFFDNCGKKINIDRNSGIGNHISIGNYSGIGKNYYISSYVSIGNYVMMKSNCLIYTINHNFAKLNIPMCFQCFYEYKSVEIEDDVWIGGRAIILPGVKIGKGAIIGAGSVVTKNVEPYTIVAGNPAKLVRKREKQR